MQKFLILLVIGLFLEGSPLFSEPPPSQIVIGRSAKLNVAPIWPLKVKGTYLQKITATVWGKEESFSVYLMVDEMVIEAIAFNEVVGRLYRLKVTPEDMLWERAEHLPPSIRPENILADFLLINLPSCEIQGARVFEKGHKGEKIRTIRNRDVLRKITYSDPIHSIWGHVVLENPRIGYKLYIQTVEQ